MPAHADTADPIIPGYIIERLLRTGGSASVYAAVHLHTGRRVALKILRKELALKGFLEGMRREAAALHLLRHINIVLAEQYLETDDFACLAMQLASGGDLLDHINGQGPLSEAQIKRVLLQVLAGLSHAHNQGVAHLDLKPDNLLLHHGRVLVADWGHAECASPRPCWMTRAAGTEVYKAPELVLQAPYDPYKADAWALGVSLFALGAGRLPFSVRSPTLQDDIVKCRVDTPVFFSSEFKSLVRGLMCVDAGLRLSVCELAQHPFLAPRPYATCMGASQHAALLPHRRSAEEAECDKDMKRNKFAVGA